eukprot:3365759-Alexandrium_andersonii.AAC.1
MAGQEQGQVPGRGCCDPAHDVACPQGGHSEVGRPPSKVREAAPFLAPGVDGLAGRFEDLQRFRRQTKEFDGLGCG